jgi:hypothetical protein
MSVKLLVQDTVAPHVKADSLVAGSGVSIVYGSGTITISSSGGGGSGGGFTWTNVTSASNPITLAPGTSYVASGGSPVVFILPASASLGDSYQIVGNGNLWQLTQNAGQSIVLGNQSSTAGVFGNVTATLPTDCSIISCIQPSSLFTIRSPQGNPTLN